jgi:hypothetical protein
LVLLSGLMTATGVRSQCSAQELAYPQEIRIRYEAVDPKVGGNFIIWLDRERFWHGLDARLYPAVRYVVVTHVTPAPGSPTITIIEVGPINSANPEFYHAAGIVRFKITGMVPKSTNAR